LPVLLPHSNQDTSSLLHLEALAEVEVEVEAGALAEAEVGALAEEVVEAVAEGCSKKERDKSQMQPGWEQDRG